MVNHRYQQQTCLKYLDQSQSYMSTLRTRVYITSFLTVASFGTMLSMFAMIKDRLNKELHLDQAFLSYLDSLYFIGKIIGTLSVLLLSNQTPKRTYFFICALSSLCQLLIPLSINFPSNIARSMMLCGMIGVGLSKAYVLTPFLFLSEYFNKPEDKGILTVWNSLPHIGDVLGVAIAWIGVYELELRWDLVYDFCVCGYFIFAVVFYLSVDEKSFNDQNQDSYQQDCQEYSTYDEQSPTTNLINKVKSSYCTLKPFYTNSLSILWCVDFCLQATFIASVIFWFPYYFVQHQFGFMATFIIIAFYVSNILGTIGFQWMLKKMESQNCAEKVCFWMIVGEIFMLAICTLLLKPDKDNAGLYIMMVTIMGCMSGGVFNRIGTVDFLSLVKENKQLKYYAIYSSRLLQGIMAIGFTTTIGHLMQIGTYWQYEDQHSLFFVMMGNLGLSLIVYSIRKFWLVDQMKREKEYFQVENQLKVDEP